MKLINYKKFNISCSDLITFNKIVLGTVAIKHFVIFEYTKITKIQLQSYMYQLQYLLKFIKY